ncbi:MAG: hypothetical protein E7591_00890 [Ruminococcaceae bacterium]|nr:hypothetical protein [Oscillospiraceae bacterium]
MSLKDIFHKRDNEEAPAMIGLGTGEGLAPRSAEEIPAEGNDEPKRSFFARETKKPIGANEISKANSILAKYKSGKANLESKIVANEDEWKLRAWRGIGKENKETVEKNSAWLWNCIVSKHADAMDSYPEPNIRPRMQDDEEEAKVLSQIIPVILEQCNFEKVYSDIQWYKLKQGAGVYGVFWDSTVNGGLGEIKLKKVDILNLFWKPGVTDIQDSPNLFYVSMVDKETLEVAYPDFKFKTGQQNVSLKQYRYDDNVDTSDMAIVVDWYYHKYTEDGRKILHLCKYSGNQVLFATENEPELFPNGWYDHGLYPFVLDVLFGIEGTPCGYSYIDIGKGVQKQIDILDDAILKNVYAAAHPRFFIRGDGKVNEEEFADPTKTFIHTQGSLGDDSLKQIVITPVSDIAIAVLNNKIEELKDTTTNRDVANGATTSGVTAASGIAAMQEAAGKVSRDTNKNSYNSYREVIFMIIELIRQFYDISRWFRVLDDKGKDTFIAYSNKKLVAQPQEAGLGGEDSGYRLPIFDIEVHPQKRTPYSKMAQNELSLQFLKAGFFNPQNAMVARAALEMMDFDHKDDVVDIINSNDQMRQQYTMLVQLALGMASKYDPNVIPQIAPMAQALNMEVPKVTEATVAAAEYDGTLAEEDTRMQNARQRTQESTQVQ